MNDCSSPHTLSRFHRPFTARSILANTKLTLAPQNFNATAPSIEGLSRSQTALPKVSWDQTRGRAANTWNFQFMRYFYCVTCALSSHRHPASGFPAKVMLLRSEDVSLFASFSGSSISFCSFPPSVLPFEYLQGLTSGRARWLARPTPNEAATASSLPRLASYMVGCSTNIFGAPLRRGSQGDFGHVVLMLDTQTRSWLCQTGLVWLASIVMLSNGRMEWVLSIHLHIVD